ncbi:MAG TPA: SxtJ family membrane protein [bacterium]|nr:SxtJ family membrane protein [bacterium]HPS30343.1 SxtJ family membrane protein [bacterium]
MDTFSEKKGKQKSVMTNRQAVDGGMALVLISLLLLLFLEEIAFLYIAIFFQVLNMTIPSVFKPFAKLWLGFSHLLGTVMSKIILSIVFYTVVTPIGFIARLAGKDSLQLKKFKKGTNSVFAERNQKYTETDVVKPY